jgi:transcriptional regulator with XRE-family HTH domain
MDTAKRLGVAIRRLRKARGLSQEAFADRVGLDRTYVSAIERGRRNPTLRIIQCLAGGLGVPVSALFLDAVDGAAEPGDTDAVRD